MKLNKFQPLIDSFIAELEAGTAPWLKDWSNLGMSLPFNGYTRKPYKGVNAIMLWFKAQMVGYTSNAWFGHVQMTELGGRLIVLPDAPPKRSGQKSTYITIPMKVQVEDELKTYFKPGWVFNADQIEGLPPTVITHPPAPVFNNDVCKDFVDQLGIQISHGFDHACYKPLSDSIEMPNPQQFETEEKYWSTLFHELTHATKAESRLGRDMGSYAMEELVAEMGSAFLCAEFGIQGELQHANYLAVWAKDIKDKPQVLWKASERAYQAHEWLINASMFDDRQGFSRTPEHAAAE